MGVSDDSLLWDTPELLWMGVVFAMLHKGDGAERIWTFSYHELCAQVKVAAATLGVQVVPYQLRHSGPAGTS